MICFEADNKNYDDILRTRNSLPSRATISTTSPRAKGCPSISLTG
jgi:hypothetical protein